MKGRPKDLTQTSQSPGPAHYTIGAGRQQGGASMSGRHKDLSQGSNTTPGSR